MRGPPAVGRRESLIQCSQKRRRCQRRTVSGETMTSAFRQPVTDSGQADPEQTIDWAELWPGRYALVNDELLAQDQVLEGDLLVAADDEGEEPKQGSTRVIMSRDCGRPARTDQSLGGGRRFGEGHRVRRSPPTCLDDRGAGAYPGRGLDAGDDGAAARRTLAPNQGDFRRWHSAISAERSIGGDSSRRQPARRLARR